MAGHALWRVPKASGVALREEILDQFVCMRFAQLVATGELETTIANAIEAAAGNGGCEALTELGSKIVACLTALSKA